jgi:hypothetical protein
MAGRFHNGEHENGDLAFPWKTRNFGVVTDVVIVKMTQMLMDQIVDISPKCW